jgi:hypothetical protein
MSKKGKAVAMVEKTMALVAAYLRVSEAVLAPPSARLPNSETRSRHSPELELGQPTNEGAELAILHLSVVAARCARTRRRGGWHRGREARSALLDLGLCKVGGERWVKLGLEEAVGDTEDQLGTSLVQQREDRREEEVQEVDAERRASR